MTAPTACPLTAEELRCWLNTTQGWFDLNEKLRKCINTDNAGAWAESFALWLASEIEAREKAEAENASLRAAILAEQQDHRNHWPMMPADWTFVSDRDPGDEAEAQPKEGK